MKPSVPPPSQPPRRRPLNALKRFAFAAVILLFLYAFAEICSAGVMSFRVKGFYSYAKIEAKRKAILDWETKEEEDGSAENADVAEKGVLRRYSYEIEMLHPYLGFVMDPDKRSRVSSFGFRSPETIIRSREPEKVIVGIMGGSVAEDFTRRGIERLEATLLSSEAFQGKRIEFVPLALGGYKQPQQLMTLSYILALGGSLDILINLDGFNEIALHPTENAGNGIAAIYPRNWAHRVNSLPDPDFLKIVGGIAHASAIRVEWGEAFLTPWARISPMANLIWDTRDSILAQRLNELNVAAEEYRSDDQPAVLLGPSMPFETEDEMYDELVEIWKRCSLQMQRLCESNSIRYFHFLQPNQYVRDSKPMGEEERKIAIHEGFRRRNAAITGYPLLIGAGQELLEQGVYYFDLTMMFKEVQEAVYRDHCCHLNARGNELLGDIIGRRVIESMKDGAPDGET